MSPEKKQTLKLLKVDNWSVFLLQRLQLMYAKGDCCDLTLKFQDQRELKVHKLVLTTCTKYFDNVREVNNIIKMPGTLSYVSMLPIINFMYSGKLEFKPDLQGSLLKAARVLNMAILVQLLIAQETHNDSKLKLAAKIDDGRKFPRKPSLPIDPLQQTTGPISMLAEKKLPFWRKRVYPLMNVPEKKEPEDPRPTRFEMPSDDTSSLMMNVPSFSEISYESEPVVPSPIDFPVRPRTSESAIKRRVAPPQSGMPQAKSQKLTESQIISGNWSDEDDDTHFENIHTYEDSDDEQEPCVMPVPEKIVTSTPKPILKPAADVSPISAGKKVRFNLSKEDKENTEGNNKTPEPSKDETVEVSQPSPEEVLPDKSPENEVDKTNSKAETPSENKDKAPEETVSNHAKIIAEVLKKYPDLVRRNKNIKLKITSPGGVKMVSLDGTKTVAPGPKSSVYSVLKPTTTGKIDPPAPVQFCREAENTTGPWICKRCTIDQKHIVFESYYLFRRHLTNVHSEKVDPKICELCGYKASKKNLHLFHLYTKHGIQPPKNIKFPKCTLCKYVALNDALLTKHYSTHQVRNKELICNICKLSFKSANSFQAHCVTCKPNSEIRTYPCKNCGKIFRTSVSMKAHFKDCCGSDSSTHLQNIEPVEMIEVPLMSSETKSEHSLVQLPSGILVADSPNMALIHPDGDGLSNVTSGLPNIGFTVLPEDHQTVILLDEDSEFFLQGNNSVVVTSESNEEYVVPEILQDNMAQLYSTSNISYTTVNGTSVITYPVVHVQPENSESSISSLPIGQNSDLFVSDKEITISEEIQDIKPRVKEEKSEGSINQPKDDVVSARSTDIIQDAVAPTTCIVRIDNDLPLNNSVCLVDPDTPISLMDSDGTGLNISMNTPVSIVDSDSPLLVEPDRGMNIIRSSNSEQLNRDIIKPTVISVAPTDHQAAPSSEPLESPESKLKVDQISTEWDFEDEEDDSEIIDDPDSRPSRPSIELHEIV